MTQPFASSWPSWSQNARAKVWRLRVMIGIALWRHGRLWAIFWVLLLVQCFMALLAHFSLAHEAQQLQEDGMALSRRQSAQTHPTSVETNLAMQLKLDEDKQAVLASVLQPVAQSGQQIRQIYQLAERYQVPIVQADFQNNADPTSIERLQIDIPTKVSYPQLRRFLEACLRAAPNASLDRLSFKRSQVGDTQVEVRIYLSLWLKAQESQQ